MNTNHHVVYLQDSVYIYRGNRSFPLGGGFVMLNRPPRREINDYPGRGVIFRKSIYPRGKSRANASGPKRWWGGGPLAGAGTPITTVDNLD